MTRSDSITDLLAALVAARAAMPRIAKDQTAIVESQRGARFTYGYADLATVLEAVTPALTANGLAVVQDAQVVDGSVVVESILFHLSGQWLAGAPLAMPLASTGAQSVGSAITYGRRYALLALLGLAAAGEDDDATGAEPPRRARSSTTRTAERGKPPAAKPTPESIAAARERLEQAASRGTEALLAELAGTPAPIIGAIGGPRRVAQLKARAKEADAEVAPA